MRIISVAVSADLRSVRFDGNGLVLLPACGTAEELGTRVAGHDGQTVRTSVDINSYIRHAKAMFPRGTVHGWPGCTCVLIWTRAEE
jgi:hypothetical protein